MVNALPLTDNFAAGEQCSCTKEVFLFAFY